MHVRAPSSVVVEFLFFFFGFDDGVRVPVHV